MNTETELAIQISLDKAKQLKVETKGIMLPDAIQLCLATIELMCKQTLSRADNEDLKKSLEEDMYEMINLGASTLLERLFPEIERNPDLTVDAIIKAEDELMKKDSEKYIDAYANSAQAQKDTYEHNLAKANLVKIEEASKANRAQRRHPKK